VSQQEAERTHQRGTWSKPNPDVQLNGETSHVESGASVHDTGPPFPPSKSRFLFYLHASWCFRVETKLQLWLCRQWHSESLGFWTFRKLDVFPSSGERKETRTLLGPLERLNLSHWSNEVSSF
jgi:hypothetical protein